MADFFKKYSGVLILILILGIILFFTAFREKKFENFLLIGWDGANREDVYKLLEENRLPNLKTIIREGQIVDINITNGETETKPGWAQILTGYNSAVTKVYDNINYEPIPEGYTIFERLENYFGKDNITTVFISGKSNNTGARGPHKICDNCLTRDPITREKTGWWDENAQALVKNPGEQRNLVERGGEPYYYVKKNIDVFINGLNEADNVGNKSLEMLEKYYDKRFFMFFHFEEPDEQGHIFGENSEEYLNGIVAADYWLGQIIAELKKLKIYDKTLIYITSDHGMDRGEKTHKNAPYVFLATNDKMIENNGDRRDITPTILKRYGFNLQKISPPLDGISLGN